jgi:hypothetical protein
MAFRRLTAVLSLAVAALLVLAPAALASNDGRGFYGATDDKVVTDAGFILILFFPALAFVLSVGQRQLEKRKEARLAAQKAHAANARWRGGW